MPNLTFHDFATITSQVIGELDELKIAKTWFCRNIYRERDLQWTGILGRIGSEDQAFAFGLNLEFTPAWRRAYPKIKNNPQYFSQLLSQCTKYEWHWMGRPGVIANNPPTRFLTPATWADKVDVTKWMSDLEAILDKRKMWSSKVPMRPQISIFRQVGVFNQAFDSLLIRKNIEQIVQELEPLAAFLGK